MGYNNKNLYGRHTSPALRALEDERPRNFRQVTLFLLDLFVLFTVLTSRWGLVLNFVFHSLGNNFLTRDVHLLVLLLLFAPKMITGNSAMLLRCTEGTPCYSGLSAIECSAVTQNIFVKSIHPHTSGDSVVSQFLCLHLLILPV